jgi:hypothetical protein
MPFLAMPTKAFRDRFPSWVRIEPRARDDDFSQGLEARTADPLWLLGRQWQMGEFNGEDTGSAIAARVNYWASGVTKARWPINPPTIERPAGPPIDATIEGQPLGWDWRRRVQIGQRYEAFIRDIGGAAAQLIIAKLRKLLPVPPGGDANQVLDGSTKRYLALMAGRVIDGKRVMTEATWGRAPAVPREWGLLPTDPAVRALVPLRRWVDEVYPDWTGGPAWNRERLRHEFALDTAGNRNARLVARDHEGGPVDWFDVRLAPIPGPAVPPPVLPQPNESRAVPTRVAFAGAPHPRWWAFEDSSLQLGQMEVNTTDVAKLALLEFAVIYANDWLAIPLPVQAGRLIDVVTVVVTDVFGREFTLTPSETLATQPTGRWQLYAISAENAPTGPGTSGMLFVPPVSSDALEMPAEELLYLRDEGANLVFGVEQRVQNARGDTVPGIEAQRERGFSGETVEEEGAVGLRFRLATPVPGNWFPFVPVARDAARREVRLRKALLLRNADDEAPVVIPPLGTLLTENGEWLEEASVPRSGVKVRLVRRRARGADGRTYVWAARQVTVGKGEGRSGLRFDVLRNGG